jgi:ABC-type phosphate transport system substrate-binding protein
MKTFISAVCATLILAAPAFADVVVVVNPAADAVTKDQVAAIYLGKSTAFTPIDQADGSAIRGEFYKKVADKDAAQAKALWSKLVFTGKASPPKEVASSAEVKKAVAANPKGIGYIEKSAVDASVKVVLTP